MFPLSRPGLLLAACLSLCSALASPVGGLRLIGVTTLDDPPKVEGTVVGGFSGMDYDAKRDRWVVISDDRSDLNPARAYTLRIEYDATAIHKIAVESLITLKQPDGSVYPNRQQFAQVGGVVPDFESTRYDPKDGTIWYSSEGDFKTKSPPLVRQAARDGKFLRELPLPAQFHWGTKPGRGPRSNATLEGLSFSVDGKTLWLAMEGPFEEDGSLPTPEAGAATRITQLTREGKTRAQYVYPLDRIPEKPAPGRFADNGISEMLAIGPQEFLVLERAGVQVSEDEFHCHVRLYSTSTDQATDVRKVDSLLNAKYTPMTKRLLVNFDQLRPPGSDNLECLSWGRKLPNGHATLIAVSDNNFSPLQKIEFYVFEVIPAGGKVAD